MKKKLTALKCWYFYIPKHTLLALMKKSLILFLLLLSFSVHSFSQRISLNMENVKISEALKEIRKKTNMDFFYSDDELNVEKYISVNFENIDLIKVVSAIVGNGYKVEEVNNSVILITPITKTTQESQKIVTIKGTVVDAKGMPISGATILIKGTNKGISTDIDGAYTIPVPVNSVLVFSYIGFEKQEITVTGDTTTINVEMKEDISELEEVLISTGYQKIKPEQSTGSVTVIQSKDFESQVSNDILSGLESRIPGLMINNDVSFTSTVDGETSNRSLFNIRGISTISGNQSPLIVVDGYPTELTLDMINPNEIKSVTVLRDASAATVYGVRASNGVIVIERKGAKPGKPRIHFRSNIGFTPKENYSRYEYASNASELAVNYMIDQYSSIDSLAYQRSFNFPNRAANSPLYYILAQQAGNIITNEQAERAINSLKSYDNTEDYERLFLRTAVTQNYNMNVSGGNENALYYLTLNYAGNKFSQVNNNDERIMFSTRTNLNLSKRLSVELLTNYLDSKSESVPVPNVNTAYRFERYADRYGNPLPVTNGSLINPYYNSYLISEGLQDHLYYPLVDINHISDNTHTINSRFTANFDYEILDGLNLSFGGVYENSRSIMEHYADEQSTEARQLINNFTTLSPSGSLIYNIPFGSYLEETSLNSKTYTLRSQLNYTTKIGENHSINAILGSEIRGILTEGSTSAFYGYNNQTLIQQPVNYSSLGSGIVSAYLGNQTLDYPFNKIFQEDRFVSVYSNIVYSFQDTYSVTGSIRIDQSNLFGTNPKYQYKPLWSLGAAWNLHKENFIKDTYWNIDELKLRLAYGFNGNVAKNSLPEVIAESYLNTNINPASTALGLYSLANNSLRWEQTRNFNVGLNFGFFNRIDGAIDFYTKKSTDVLSNFEIDQTYGASTSLLNVATINNKGVELNLNGDWISNPRFNWNTGFIMSHNTSKVLDVYEYATDDLPSELNSRGYVAGYPVGALFAYPDEGLDDEGYPVIVNEDGEIISASGNITQIQNASEVIRYMGSSIPTINIGLSNRIDVGNFYFFYLASYYGGFKVKVPRTRPGDPVVGSENYWKQPGDELSTNILGLEANSTALSSYIYDNLDSDIVNGDYITLRTVTASYNFNDSDFSFLKKAGISNFEVKLQANNIFTVGLNKYNYSQATGNYFKRYMTPTYTASLLFNF